MNVPSLETLKEWSAFHVLFHSVGLLIRFWHFSAFLHCAVRDAPSVRARALATFKFAHPI